MDVVQVSRVQEIFGSVLAVEEESLSKEISVPEMLELVSTVNTVLQVTFLCGFCVYCMSQLFAWTLSSYKVRQWVTSLFT